MSGPFSSAGALRGLVAHLSLACTLLVGCGRAPVSADQGQNATVSVTSVSIRAGRRLYNGAPPVIPHAPLKISCIECHTPEGKATPPLGVAPANPHWQTNGIGAADNCRQCHVFQTQSAALAENDFAGLTQRMVPGERLYRGAPPVIPHPVFMREDCAACHAGIAARAETRCTHPTRSNCRQCHAASPATSASAESSSVQEFHAADPTSRQ